MVNRIRRIIQHLFFVLLLYGGRFGIHLGHSLPCFACPYVGGCGGHCYLMALQRSHAGVQIAFADLFSGGGLTALWYFAVFLLFFLPLSKLWCGWICPFCLFQDWIAMIRKKLGIREMTISRAAHARLKPVKYGLLGLLLAVPLLIANAGLHPDWRLPFCQICPARPLLSVFEGNFSQFFLDFTNGVTLGFSIAAMVITGGMLAGMFFKERFFCLFCPMLGLMHLFRRFSPVRFVKDVESCTGCGNCERLCPVDIHEVHLEDRRADVMNERCMGCMNCAESCPGDGALAFTWFGRRLFSSSRQYVARKRGR